MDALRNVYKSDDQQSPTPPAASAQTPEQEMTSKLVEDSGVEGKAVLVSEDELSAEDVKMFAEAHNEYSSDDDEENEDELPSKKQLQLSSLFPSGEVVESTSAAAGGVPVNTTAKKIKKKYSCVWTRPAPRKGKKKVKPANVRLAGAPLPEHAALVTPMPKHLERCDDSPDMSICLSKVYKAEKVDLSEDRMSAGSIKGYRMVRATRGVVQGAWFFEIKVVHLGVSGHTRLGWSTEKGDLQAPVGYDAYSYGYRDIDGDTFHKGQRNKYGAGGYMEGDVIGFYINLPNGEMYAPKQSHVVLYKGQKYLCAPEEEHATSQVVPGSCISFFKNGISQGIAYNNITGGRYYPAASMYTLPNQQNCEVKFNFGPDFDYYPTDFGDCPIPKPMFDVPYHGYENRVENTIESIKGNAAGNAA